MNMPWAGKAGLSKAVSIFATLLMVSIGLCGANFATAFSTTQWTYVQPYLNGLMTITGCLEVLGMAAGLVGLAVCGVIFVVRLFANDIR